MNDIIPKPKQIRLTEGRASYAGGFMIRRDDSVAFDLSAAVATLFPHRHGRRLDCILAFSIDPALGPEAYRLTIAERKIEIVA
ncbi:MAG: hypothetical protein Q8N15_02375, partial [Bacillota bacterium]|nr:hypothetical protein [Bacillota bacterium]